MPCSYLGGRGVRAGSVIECAQSQAAGLRSGSPHRPAQRRRVPFAGIGFRSSLSNPVVPSGCWQLPGSPLSYSSRRPRSEVTQRAECPGSPPALCTAGLGPGPKGGPRAVRVRPAQSPPDLPKSCAGDWKVPPFPPPWVFPTCISADAGALVFCP